MDDDLIKAALIGEEEDKKLQEEKSTEDSPSQETDAPEDSQTEDEETEETDEEADTEETSNDAEAETEVLDDPKPTRKERREERRQRWLESVRKDQEHNESQQVQQQPQQQQEQYNPLDYTKLDEVEPEALAKDREAYGEQNRRLGAQEAARQERFISEQKNFWKDVQHEAERLTYDPKFEFLDENKSDSFDPDLAADLNEKYLEFVGFDPNSNTVSRTNISYEKFVRKEMAEREQWAERLAADAQRVVEETKAATGVRPGGTRKSGIGKLKPGDISKMSDKEYEKYEAEINRQIAAELGIN